MRGYSDSSAFFLFYQFPSLAQNETTNILYLRLHSSPSLHQYITFPEDYLPAIPPLPKTKLTLKGLLSSAELKLFPLTPFFRDSSISDAKLLPLPSQAKFLFSFFFEEVFPFQFF